MQRVLITGGAGFVGTALTQLLLAEGYHVRVLDNFIRNHGDALLPFLRYDEFEFQRGDVTSLRDVQKAAKDVDAVIHLAALVGAPVCQRNNELAWLVNFHGTENVLRAKGRDVPFLYASTGSVYGKVDGVCTEDSPLNTLSVYGQSKLAAEKATLDRPNTLAYRFATGYGVSPNVRMDLLVNDLVHQAVVNRSLVIFEADFARTFIHVREMARSFLFGLLNFPKLTERVYNVGHESGNWTKRQLAEHIRGKTGCAVFYADKGFQDVDQRSYVVDYGRIRRAGWQPTITLENGIDELIKSIPVLDMSGRYAEKI